MSGILDVMYAQIIWLFVGTVLTFIMFHVKKKIVARGDEAEIAALSYLEQGVADIDNRIARPMRERSGWNKLTTQQVASLEGEAQVRAMELASQAKNTAALNKLSTMPEVKLSTEIKKAKARLG